MSYVIGGSWLQCRAKGKRCAKGIMANSNNQLPMDDFLKFKPGEGRWQRFFQHPLRFITITLLRRSRLSKEIVIRTPLGFRFAGLLPESVSALIWRFGIYEWSSSILLMRVLRQGDHMIDIGSHFGYFTLLAGSLVGKAGQVVAIEAMPDTYKRLQRNIALNRLENVRAVNAAAHSRSERLSFRDFGLISSSLNTSGTARGALLGRDAPAKDVSVNGDRFDSLIAQESWPLIRAVKIDAESSEQSVLEGMSGFFASGARPLLLIELGGGGLPEADRARAIAALLAAYDYRPYTFDGYTLRPVRIDDDLAYMNAVFVAGMDGPAGFGLDIDSVASGDKAANRAPSSAAI